MARDSNPIVLIAPMSKMYEDLKSVAAVHAERGRMRLLAILLAMLVVFHASMLVAYNLPYNPLTGPFQSQINRYILPLMFQQWGFFAPTPGGWIDEAFVRYRVRTTRGTTETPWFDLNSLFPASVQMNPLSPFSIDRDVYYSTLIAVNDDIRDLHRFEMKSGDDAVMDMGDLTDQERGLVRFALALSPALCVSPAGSVHDLLVQVNVSRRPFPHFAKHFNVATNVGSSEDQSFDTTAIARLPWVTAESVPAIGQLSACGGAE